MYKNQKYFLHGSYIGTTGYNQHTRDFVRHLSDLTDIKVRNFTVGKTWAGMSDNPHDNESYFNEIPIRKYSMNKFSQHPNGSREL